MPISRRTLLLAVAGSAAATAAGCSAESLPVLDTESPDDVTRRSVAESEAALIAAYRAAAAETAEGARWEFLAGQHVQHLAALYPGDTSATASPSTAAAPPGRKALRRMEARAARQRTDAAVAAQDAELAQLLARIATAEAGHAAYLSAAGS